MLVVVVGQVKEVRLHVVVGIVSNLWQMMYIWVIPFLRRHNTPIEFSQEQIEEYIKCREDPVYFVQNYVKIVTLDHGLQPFKTYDFQEKLINNFHNHRFNICKMPRQTGKSTTCVSYLLHYAIFNDSVNIGILANKATTVENC